MKKKITLNVRKEKFLAWYIDEDSIAEVIRILRKKGIVSINDLTEILGYIPLKLIINREDVRQEDLVESDEIENPGSKYTIKIV